MEIIFYNYSILKYNQKFIRALKRVENFIFLKKQIILMKILMKDIN